MGKPMKLIIYNFTMLIGFFIMYILLRNQLDTSKPKGDIDLVDLFNLSATIQTAIGITLIYPTGLLAKIVIITQQLMLIFGNLLIFHL